jgi:hypothetical protein
MSRKRKTDCVSAGREWSGLRGPLVWAYGILAIAALGRSSYQIATKFDQAPLAYVLSAVAAVVYLVATVAILRFDNPLSSRLATWSLSLETVGVVSVGSLSLFRPDLFPADTVWSGFGSGYLYIPLVLPVLGLWWLRTQRVVP